MEAIDFGNYLRGLRKDKGLTIRQVELYSGVSNAYLSQLENGKRGIPSPDILRKLSDCLDISYEELMKKAGYLDNEHDEGFFEAITNIPEQLLQRFDINDENNFNGIIFDVIEQSSSNGVIDEESKKQITNFLAYINDTQFDRTKIDSSEYIKDFFRKSPIKVKLNFVEFMFVHELEEKRMLKSNNQIGGFVPVTKRVQLPIVGTVKAGPNGIAYEDHLGMEWVDKDDINGGQYIWLRIKGDSMTGEGIFPGDLALVRIQPEVENGDLSVVIVNGEEGTLKRVYMKEGSIVLQSSNPQYPPRIFTGNELENIRIVGKVKETKRKY